MYSIRILLSVALCLVIAEGKPSWIHHYPLLHHHVVQPVVVQPVAIQPVVATHTVTHVVDPWAHVGRVAAAIGQIGSSLIKTVVPSVISHIVNSKQPVVHSTTHIVHVPQTVVVPAPHPVPVYVSHPVQPVIIQSPPPVIINQQVGKPLYESPKSPALNLEDDVGGSSLSSIGNSQTELDTNLGGDAGGNFQVGIPNELSLNQGSSVSLSDTYGPPNL